MTVEAAIALGALALVTALAVGAVTAVGAAVRCTDAARELARLAARGEPERGRAAAATLAPAQARIALTIRGDEVTAEVTAAPVRLLPVRVSGRAVAVLEPGAAPSGEPPPEVAGARSTAAPAAVGSHQAQPPGEPPSEAAAARSTAPPTAVGSHRARPP